MRPAVHRPPVPPGANRASGRALVVDPTFGVAGDMLLAALLDAGADEAFVRACVEAVLPDTVDLRIGRTSRQGMTAATVHVALLREDQPHRPWPEVRALIDAAVGESIPQAVHSTALRVFTELSQAEGAVHGVPADEVHFHEVGAWDSIADIVGLAAALNSLQIDHIETLPVTVGSGTVRAAHGLMPVPVPAVLELLARSGLPWQAVPPGAGSATHDHRLGGTHDHDHHHHGYSHDGTHDGIHDGIHDQGHTGVVDLSRLGELATPTGVAVLAALAQPLDAESTKRVVARGVGAGSKNFAGWPNVVRVAVTDPHLVDAPVNSPKPLITGPLRLLEANVDDVDPRIWPAVLDGLLAAGARDAWLTPLLGKKGRSGHTVSVLVDPNEVEPHTLVMMLMQSSGTLGVRELTVQRHALHRGWMTVSLPDPLHGDVRIKYGLLDEHIVHATPEYEDCARVARTAGVPVMHVLDAARAAADAAGLLSGAPRP